MSTQPSSIRRRRTTGLTLLDHREIRVHTGERLGVVSLHPDTRVLASPHNPPSSTPTPGPPTYRGWGCVISKGGGYLKKEGVGGYRRKGVGWLPGYSSKWRRLCEQQRKLLVDPHCWECGYPIDLDLDPRDAESLTFDHVVPLLLGGEDTVDNMTPAHRGCNTRRSNRIRAQLNELELPMKHSRKW